MFEILLVTATFLCTLVFGFLFAFAVVVMPGIKKLDDRSFIRTFQVMDGIIQANQPLFLVAWLGSAISIIAAAGVGAFELMGAQRILVIVAAAIYALAVQLPTLAFNMPLNNKLQSCQVETTSEKEHQVAREEFEARWNRWNVIRTWFASIVSLLLIVLLLRH